jgi:hypothetical protein
MLQGSESMNECYQLVAVMLFVMAVLFTLSIVLDVFNIWTLTVPVIWLLIGSMTAGLVALAFFSAGVQ